MKFAYNRFCNLIKDIDNVNVVYEYLEEKIRVPIDTSDLLRWQWVQCVSAFDKFIHDIVRIGMIETFQKARSATPKYNTFLIDLQTYADMYNLPLSAAMIFEREIIKKHGYKSFQEPDKVADALSYIWGASDKWNEISKKIGMNKNDCITFLKNIVIRRNQIVHEGDYVDAHSDRQEIYKEDVHGVKGFILNLGQGIFDLVNQQM